MMKEQLLPHIENLGELLIKVHEKVSGDEAFLNLA